MALTVQRLHGLGNVFMLLPVLVAAKAEGREVKLVTRSLWLPALEMLGLRIGLTATPDPTAIDLDAATLSAIPSKHRTFEFAEMLSVRHPIGPVTLPRHLDVGRVRPIVFAPEAGHPSRVWPGSFEFARRLRGRRLTLVGLETTPQMPCDEDLRGNLSLEALMRVVASAGLVVCMDSSVLQIAMMAGVPVLAIFGGIEPAYRVLPEQRTRVVVADLPCRPCNKRETCEGRFPCVRDIGVDDVLRAMDGIGETAGLELHRIAMPMTSVPCQQHRDDHA